MKRKLSEEEIKLNNTAIDKCEGKMEWLEYQVESLNLLLDKGLELEHEKNVEHHKVLLKQNLSALNTEKEYIKLLRDQNLNGVDPVEKQGETNGGN